MATPNLFSIVSVTPAILASSQLASGDNTVYTVASNKAVKLTKLVLANVSVSTVVISASVIPSGSSVDGTHRVVSGYSLAAGDTMVITEIEGMFLGQGDFISINAAAATAIDATLNGLVFA